MRLAQFLEYLEERAGDSLRAVEWYRGHDAELIHLRDDLEQSEVQRRAKEIHANVTLDDGSPGGSELDGLGSELATVSLREQAVLINLPINHNYGVVVGLDPDAARKLHEFVVECREVVTELEEPPE